MLVRRHSDVELPLDTHSVEDQVTPTAPPDVEDIEMNSGDTPGPLTLPPHLVARLYPVPKDRRRASASSSRRSSISSLHSLKSTHGSSHSDHMVQHMRRASIIESRKARLADRAAHVEKVRLRAALAKTGTRNAVKEERAAAAQQAREKLLAEIAAKCEEEVRRAKQKAEEIKERKAAEHARLKAEMAEKFAEVERRRLLYQQSLRRPRRTSSAERRTVKVSLDEKKLSQQDAACIIQSAWRNYRARATIKRFRTLDLSLERIRNLAFEEVGALLSKEDVLTITNQVLRLCGLQDAGEGSMCERGAVRVFLSSFLILSHPAQVLSSSGEQEHDLIAKAQDLLVIFEQVITQLSSIGVSPVSVTSDMQSLAQSYNTFFSAFHAWKSHDSTVLIEIMLSQFVELELIWQTVKDDREGGVADDYQKGIRQNQILLLARLKRLAGPDKAMEMVKHALRKAKREKRRNESSPQAIPRSVTEQPSHADAPSEDVHTPLREVFLENPDQSHQQIENEMNPQDRFVKLLTALPDNRTLVHELLINREFKIDQTSYTQVRRQVMRHMCNMMRKDIEVGHGTKWTVAMATVIQDRLLRSLKPGNSLHNLIREVLDPTHIENQCRGGTFSYHMFFDFMSDILPRLCAPFRDPDVKAFAEDKSGDTIDRLERLMGIIDLLSLDHSNFMLRMAAPQLIQEGPGYEQRAFSRDLQNGTITLEKTKQFWRTNRDAILEEMRKRDPENGNIDTSPPLAKIYAQGLVNLVLSNGRLSRDRLPETLSLDYARLEHLRSQSFKIAATAAILLSAKNLLKRDVRSQWKAEAERILALDFSEIKPERVQSILDSIRPMPAATRTQLFATIKRVLLPASAASATASSSSAPGVVVTSGPDMSALGSPSSAHAEPAASVMYFTDPVAKLMLSRLRAHVLMRLSAASARERVRITTTASQSLAAAGMPEFVSEVGALVDSLNRIREVDWMCHGLAYEKIWAADAGSG